MADVRQESFAGGVFAPFLWSRTDLARYGSSLRDAENVIVTQHGAAANRCGTRLVAACKYADREAALVPFVFSSELSYVVELGHLYLRFHSMGVTVAESPGGPPVELETPYTADQVMRVRYAQVGNTLFLTHPDHRPKRLVRASHTAWTLEDLVIQRSAQPPVLATDWTGQTNMGEDHAAYDPTRPRAYGVDPADTQKVRPYKAWEWVVTTVLESGEESLPSSPPLAIPGVLPNASILYPDRPATIAWDTTGQAATSSYRVYRGRNGEFGLIGETGPGATLYRDDGAVPAYSDAPPKGVDPFSGPGKYPSVVAVHQQRLVFAGSYDEPQTIWFSKVGEFYNFDYASPAKDDDAITLTLASKRREEVRALVPLRTLLVLTASSETTVDGDGGPVTPTALNARPQSLRGSSWVEPLAVGATVVYVQDRGAAVRDITYQYTIDGYDGNDVSVLAQHLFDGHRITDAAYSQLPDSILWYTREDGVLLGLTYVKEHEVWGWHRHTTDGFFEAVATVPENCDDTLYTVVRRTVGGQVARFVERLEDRRVRDHRTMVFSDCALLYDGRTKDGWVPVGCNDTAQRQTATLSFYAPDLSPGAAATVLSDEPVFDGADVGSQVVVGYGGDAPIRCTVSVVAGAYTAEVVFDTDPSALPASTTEWAWARVALSGLDAHEGAVVSVLADGEEQARRTVVGGVVELDSPATLVVVGRVVESFVELLDLRSEQVEARYRPVRVSKVGFELYRTRGVEVGETRDDLVEWKQRDVAAGYDTLPLFDGVAEVRVRGSWNQGGRAVLVQRAPLPFMLLGVKREVEVGR